MTVDPIARSRDVSFLRDQARLVTAVRQPVAMSVVERGPQGAPGDYGYVRYGESMSSTPYEMPAATDTPFAVRAPQTVVDDLKDPFHGFAFFGSDGVLRPRRSGDSYQLSVRLTVTPAVKGGWFSFSVYIAGNITGTSGPTSSRKVALSGQAGDPFRFDELFQLFPSSGFASNGARLIMRSSVPVTLSDDVVYLTPLVAAP